jgi:tripartite-type tricarboxylate transporter receptor subunit TctC
MRHPTGYTLLMGPASVYAISATLYPKLDYDLVKDLVPVSLVANVPHVLLVNVDLAVKSVPELIQIARKQPAILNIASQGSGTVSHLEAELLKHMAAIDMVHIPYRGSAPAAFAKLVREEMEKWRPVVKMSGATPD